MHVEFNKLFGKETVEKTTVFILNLMNETPKKPGKKSGRKAKQREASDLQNKY